MMASEPGANRLHMKFTNGEKKVVTHLVRGLSPKIAQGNKAITITFAESRAIRPLIAPFHCWLRYRKCERRASGIA
jgi:hypothetical protein